MGAPKGLAPSNSGVARVHCALEQETFLRPLSTKPTEFEVKNTVGTKVRKKQKQNAFCSYFVLF